MTPASQLLTHLRQTPEGGEIVAKINGQCHRVTGSCTVDGVQAGKPNIVIFAEPEARDEVQVNAEPPAPPEEALKSEIAEITKDLVEQIGEMREALAELTGKKTSEPKEEKSDTPPPPKKPGPKPKG